MEARDGIEPPNKALQTLPFSFWVPRHFLRHLDGKGDTGNVTSELYSNCDPPRSFIDEKAGRESRLVNEHTFNLGIRHIP